MADYDLYSNVKPVAGTAGEVTMDGTTYSASVDTFDWKSCTFLANIHANALYSDVTWTLQDSDDDSTFATVDSSLIISRNPSTATTQNKAFHVGYIGKKRYVKAKMECDGTTAVALNATVNAAQSITTLTSSSTTATAVKTSHGYVAGQYVTIAGALPVAYNGRYRIVTVADANHFTYTFAGGTSPATGTITAAGEDNWTNDEGADVPTSITDSASALSGTYVLTVSKITGGSAVSVVAKATGNSGTGTVTVASISAQYADPIFNETMYFKCTATAGNAGTFTGYRADGTSVGTVTVGGGATNVTIAGQTAYTITIADGTPDWALNDRIDVTITDLGKNRYILTNPDGDIVGYPVGTIAFTSSELNFTVPDTTVAVTDATATLNLVVTKGLAKGSIMAVLSNPVSGPIFGDSLET